MKIRYFAAIALVGAAMFFTGRACKPAGSRISATRIDTLIVRDTVRDTVLVATERSIVRFDTVYIHSAGDTVRVEVPVERKTYLTNDYRAVVEGFRPALVEMEIYRQTRHIIEKVESTNTNARRRWAVGVQAGYGISHNGPVPYIGVGVQYNIVSW